MDHVLDLFVASNVSPSRQPVDMCLGNSWFVGENPPVLELDPASQQEARVYGEFGGRRTFRAALSAHYAKTFGLDIAPHRFVITDGGTGALMAAYLLLAETGSEIVLPEICWPPYKMLAHMVGATCRFVPVDDRHLFDLRALRSALGPTTAAIVLNSPANPSTSIADRSYVDELCSYGVPIISDEVYRDLALDGMAPTAATHADRHIIINSFSKTLAIAGWRIGYMIVPEHHVSIACDVRAILNICTSVPVQIVAERVFARYDSITGAHRDYLRHNRDVFLETCSALGLDVVMRPSAGFFGMIDVARSGDSFEIAQILARDFAVATAPGVDFARRDPGFLRVNFSTSPTMVAEGLTRIAECLASRKSRSHVVP
jgi:aspartate/methionine/tyrosine aminotransferase